LRGAAPTQDGRGGGPGVGLATSCGATAAPSARMPVMVFGQQSGPPASAKQVQELLKLLKVVGHRDFRDARGPLGFTQRQAAGKFTRDEAAEFIGRLQQTEFEGTATVAAAPAVSLSSTRAAPTPGACGATRG